MKKLKMWLRYRLNFHLIVLRDCAEGRSRELTCRKFECLLCGKLFYVTTLDGYNQLRRGVPDDERLQWMQGTQKNGVMFNAWRDE